MPKYPVPSINAEFEQVCEARMEVNLEPTPAQSTRFTKLGRAYVPNNVRIYKRLVADHGRDCLPDDWDAGLVYDAEYQFFVPSHHRKDLDNLSKPFSDALSGVFWYDDAQICRLSLSKFYSPGQPRIRSVIRGYRVHE